jgi:hypothetical protein
MRSLPLQPERSANIPGLDSSIQPPNKKHNLLPSIQFLHDALNHSQESLFDFFSLNNPKTKKTPTHRPHNKPPPFISLEYFTWFCRFPVDQGTLSYYGSIA